jgi:hypothetical protein
MGLIAHAGRVLGASFSYDGTMVFTAGASDYGIMSWQVHNRQLLLVYMLLVCEALRY